ncbi:MAG: Alcohol dehydrogenase 2 [Anaerolineae bacterium]|nr:Alcohol dehydrogenase 2 [Anaerolineae bacterium]
MSQAHELRKFLAPEFIFGNGARQLAGQYARNLGARNVLVVTDPGVIAAGWVDDVLASLRRKRIQTTVFDEVTPNPRDHEVMAGAELYLQQGCNAIVAVGGGSPMDCAKGIGIVSSSRRHILDFEGVDNVITPPPPLFCIPTTAGSSADVSQFAIITDTTRKVKIAIISKAVVPDVALIDPETTTTMNPYITACTGIDALSHAFEAYVSNAQSAITDLHALEAVRLVSKHLIAATQRPTDPAIRAAMMQGSLYAGMAFSNASLGAVHAMAHSLGGFLDFPHGATNAILLPYVVEYNFEAAPGRYLALAQAMGITPTPGNEREELLQALFDMRQTAGFTDTLTTLGLDPRYIPQLAQNAMQDACIVTNPRPPTQEDIELIYERAI